VSTYCVYAIVAPAAAAPRIRGLRGEQLQRVAFPHADAIVGRLSSAPRATSPTLRRYDEVVRALTARYPAILPARFGTCVADLAELEAVVRARREAVTHALRLVRNRVQMTVRVFRAEGSDRDAREPDTGGPEGPPLQIAAGAPGSPLEGAGTDRGGRGTKYLQARAAEEAAQRDVPEFRPLRPAVNRWIRGERVERRDAGTLAASVYHLIPRAAAAAYRRALERAAHEAEVRVVVSGPWPPYAFAEIL